MKILRNLLFTALAVTSFANPFCGYSQSSLLDSQQESAEISLDEVIYTPVVPTKQKSYVASYMHEVAVKLIRDRYETETMRDKEVVIITIPSDTLFYPNEDTLLPSAHKILSPFSHYITSPEKFKLAIVAHCDNTGSENYSYELTDSRINSILTFFENQKLNVDSIYGFPMGFSSPRPNIDNNTRIKRALNRRIEIYIIPNTKLYEGAKKK